MYEESLELLECLEIDGLEIGDFLGSGNFSSVFKGFLNDDPVAIKVFTSDSQNYEQEINFMRVLNDVPHCVKLIEAPEDFPVMIMNYIEGLSKQEIDNEITVDGLRNVLRCVFECLKAVHAKGCVHRDLKLDNIMISRDFSTATVVDWGFGARITPKMTGLIGSRMYRSPEMLFNYQGFGSTGDIWAVGVVILDLLTKHNLPWKGADVWEELAEMTKIFGSKVSEYASDLGISLKETSKFVSEPVISLADCVVVEKLNDPMLVDLMTKLLSLDYRNRPTAAEALLHPFFQ